MDSISKARDFFINQQGLSPDQADMIVSKGMEVYNQQSQPQNMMQMASGGIARLGYQMGGSPMGVQSMPMDYGRSLQVNGQGQGQQLMSPDYSSAKSITSNPLLNYGQAPLADAGGTPLTMRSGGIARLGYQMGGDVGMNQMGGEGGQMDPQQALTVILQMLVESGIPIEEAQKLAIKIIELFTQGGEQAVEAFANQLEQEEAQAMASGGIAGYGYRQGYGLGSIVKGIVGGAASAIKGVGNVVKSIAKSPIGKIALTAAAVYFGGPMLASGLGISGAAGAALAGGLANSALQIASGQKFNPLEALISAGGAYAGAGGFSGGEAANAATTAANAADYVAANPVSSLSTAQTLTSPEYLTGTITQPSIPLGGTPSSFPTATPNITGTISQPSSFLQTPNSTGLEGQVGTGYAAAPANQPYWMQGVGPNSTPITNVNDYSYPGTLDKIKTSVSNYGTDLMNKAQTGIQNLYQDPLGTIAKAAGSAYDTAKENIVPLSIGAATGYALGAPQQPNESDEDFAKRQQEEVNPLITYYGRNLQIKNPYFYQKFGATNPFETAAQGGIMGYKQGGTMVPPARQIDGGVIELDARKSGGYIPYGKKERHDDVPAMLAKDEFVFTSKAVKAAGGGSAKRGAEKMYALMKQLEGARA
jgi:hypothetical protein